MNGVEHTCLAQILEQHKSVSFYKAAPFLEPARLALVLASLRWPGHDAPLLCAMGSQLLGPLAPSGIFREAVVDASVSLCSLLETSENYFQLVAKSAPPAKQVKVMWEKTLGEVAKGVMEGPFTRAEIDQKFGRGRWRRPIERFALFAEFCHQCDRKNPHL